MSHFTQRIRNMALLLIGLLCLPVSGWSADSDVIDKVTSSKSGDNVTFTVTRKNTSAATIVNYRTLDGSAVGGYHFTHVSGQLFFKRGEASKIVVVNELNTGTSINAYGNNGDREYYFVAWNSFCEPMKVTRTIANSLKYESHNSSERSKWLGSDFWWNDDYDVWQKCHLSDMVSAEEEAYRKATGQNDWWYKFYTTFRNVSRDNGWFNTWYYLGGSQVHHFEYEDAPSRNCREPWWGNGELWERCSSNREFSVKWRSHGSGDDYAKVYDFYVRCFYLDQQAPSVKSLIVNTIHPYATGDEVYVSLYFDELVNTSQTPSTCVLSTNAGDLTYVCGDGSNVLCFKTKLEATTDLSKLEVTGANFKVKDIAGNVQSNFNISNGNFKYKATRLNSFSIVSNLWERKNKLSWSNNDTKNEKGLWYIYRYKTSEGPSDPDGSDYPYPLLNNEKDGTASSFEDKSEDFLYDMSYTYLLQFVPSSWNIEDLFLDHFNTMTCNNQRFFNIDLNVESHDKYISLSWNSDEFQDTKTHEFHIFRKEGLNGKFEEIKTVSSSTKFYDDYNVSGGCFSYYYKVTTTSLFADKAYPSGVEYSSDSTKSGKLTTESQVISLEATKGTYANTVKLTWNARQSGIEETKYVVSRRDLNSSDNWVKIHTTSGTSTVYSFDDNTAQPGMYYEYKVSSSYMCKGIEEQVDSTAGVVSKDVSYETDPIEVTDDGFCRALGVISGRITFGTGMAVSGAKVLATKNDDSDVNQFYSLRVNGLGSGIQWPLTTKQGADYFNKPWSIQMYVNPDVSITNTTGEIEKEIPLVQSLRNFGLYLTPNDTNGYTFLVSGPSSTGDSLQKTDLSIPADKFSHVTFSYDGTGQLTVRVTDEYGTIMESSKSISQINFVADNDTVESNSVFFGKDANGVHLLQGYMDEIRVFSDKELSNDDILANYNRTLSGTESKLVLYWPLDEGIKSQKNAYDYSKTSGVTNNNHGKILLGSAVTSNRIPTSDQLSVFGVTDEMGNYTINGIPFSGDGTTYMVTPILGIHEFSPHYASRFVSASSLVYSGVDFDDVSSFPVSGVVTYFNTNFPVEGASFYVDGTVCSKDGGIVVSDAEGKFTISVPIGDHHITVKKDGHVFVDNGRFPGNPTEEEPFNQARDNVAFYDSTFVTLTGRVSGGLPESKKAHGFGLGDATIGTATIVLSAGDKYQFNMRMDTVRSFDCPSGAISSTATTGMCDHGVDARTITIHTDSASGEFAVSVPPLDFSVKSVKVDNNSEIVFPIENIENIMLFSGDLQDNTDTMVFESGDTSFFTYRYALDLIHRSKPVLELTSLDNRDGAFGDPTYVYKDEATGLKDTIALYSIVNDSVKYTFGYPLFTQLHQYSHDIYAYELYENFDGDSVRRTEYPLNEAKVTINNSLGASQIAISDGVDEKGNEVNDGDIIEIDPNTVLLDENGRGSYTFQATYPNIVSPYNLGMEISFVYDDKSYDWDQNGLFNGIVIGGLQSGNNFVTGGPDEVSFVLRDPPGTGSSAYLEKGTTITSSYHKSKAFDSQNSITATVHCGIKIKVSTGSPFFMLENETNETHDLIVGTEINGSYTSENVYTTSTTTSQRISTSDAMNYVGEDGDVFIGSGTNYIFGKERLVSPLRQGDGSYKIELSEALGIGQTFTTAFKYTQNYVENVLIPNFEDMRNSQFVKYCNVPDSLYNTSYPNLSDKPIYITKLDLSDPRLGSRNTDKDVWGNLASKKENEGPSYIMIVPNKQKCYSDTIVWFNNQIETWQNHLMANEKAKVTAIQKGDVLVNHSFDSGSSVENSVESCSDVTSSSTSHCEAYLIVGTELGFAMNGVGVSWEGSLKEGYVQDWGTEKGTTNCTNVGYSLVEDGDDDALTVDVYEAPDGFGPIFYTRGGQTTCPYEDQKVTKYFEPGEHVLAEKTMKIEYPRITVGEGNLEAQKIIDVPSGSAANFSLNLDNLSETSENVWYMMYVVDESNPNGAALTIDGVPFSTARQTLVNALETTHKNLQIKQSRPDIMKYDSIAVVLASNCQFDGTDIWEVIADTVYLSVEFVPSCSPITLQIDNRTMNSSTHDTLQLAVKDFEKDYLNFNEIRIQYKGERDNDWRLATSLNVGDLEGTTQFVQFPMPSTINNDQTYQFRAVSVCQSGTNTSITNESDVIEVVKDMERPQVLGNPNPSDGILDAGDEISVTFNEDIRNSLLSKLDNFIVQGVLNDAEVDHNVALKLDPSSNYVAATEADIVLANKNFSMDMWVYLASDGVLLNHASSDESFTMSVEDQGKLSFVVNGAKVTSTAAIPFYKWCFLTFNFTAGEDSSSISSLVAYDNTQRSLFIDTKVPNYGATGKLSVGKNLRGVLDELVLWDTNRSNLVAQSQMHFQKAPSTENLIGYWKFNEGHGSVAVDAARSRNMVVAANCWYLNNINYAASFDGNGHFSADISSSNALSSDDYMVEMWFRGDYQSNATLWSAGSKVSMKFNASGYLTLVADGVEEQLSSDNYLDGVWHHVALNVLRNGTASVYVDGKTVKQLASSKVPALQAKDLTIGAQYSSVGNVAQYSDYFKGDVDEVRYWLATFNAKAIDQLRYVRLKGDEAGLEAYYPFERKFVDAGQTKYEFALDEMSDGVLAGSAVSVTQAQTAPALQAKPNMTDISFNFVASERTIVISLNEKASRLEGTTVNFTVKNVRDENNNFSLPVMWSAYINQNRLVWEEDAIALTKSDDESVSFSATVSNQGASTEVWSISGLPSWLTASVTSGSLGAQKSETITFKVSDAVAVGKYDETIYLQGNEGINVPFMLSLKVSKQRPDWSVDPSMFEGSMSMLSQLKIEDVYTDDEEDLVAAFVNGKCVGVASPVYYPRYDAFYVSMDIYGNADDTRKNVVFKAWDASTGVIYPVLVSSESIVYEANSLKGTMGEPIMLNTASLKEQPIELKAGWNWVSLNVKPSDNSVDGVFGNVAAETNLLKSQSSVAYSDGQDFMGTLSSIEVGSMYKVNMMEDASLSVVGASLDLPNEVVKVANGWNWIGYNRTSILSLNQALAGLDPKSGDLIKGQSGFAYYEGYEWVGTLTSLVPGRGYMYYSTVDSVRTFTYPSASVVPGFLAAPRAYAAPRASSYSVVDAHAYSGNMTIVAVVSDNDTLLRDCEVGAFVGTECRASAVSNGKGLLFLTISGDANASSDSLAFKVMVGGEERVAYTTVSYVEDANYGSLANPFVIFMAAPANDTPDTPFADTSRTEVAKHGVTVMAVLMDNDSILANCALGAFVNGKCVSAGSTDAKGRITFSIEGDSSDVIQFFMMNGGSNVEAVTKLYYADNAVYGSESLPFVIQMNAGNGFYDVLSDAKISVYPTWVENDIFVKTVNVDVTRYTVLNLSGVSFMMDDCHGSDWSVNVSGLQSGEYVIVLETSEGRFSQMFTKK